MDSVREESVREEEVEEAVKDGSGYEEEDMEDEKCKGGDEGRKVGLIERWKLYRKRFIKRSRV